MNFTGKQTLNHDIKKVWLFLNEPDKLQKCIDGCKNFSKVDENKYRAIVNIKLGPINVTFNANIFICDIKEPNSYSIIADGNAGQLGYAKSKVSVELNEHLKKTTLFYDADTKISGKIAQIGSRLIEGSVKKNTEKFFYNLEKILSENEENINSEETKNNVIKKINRKNSAIFLIFLFIFFMLVFFIFANNL